MLHLLAKVVAVGATILTSTSPDPTVSLSTGERVFCLSTLDMRWAVYYGLNPESKKGFLALKRVDGQKVTSCEWASIADMEYVGRTLNIGVAEYPVHYLYFVEKKTNREWHTWIYDDH